MFLMNPIVAKGKYVVDRTPVPNNKVKSVALFCLAGVQDYKTQRKCLMG